MSTGGSKLKASGEAGVRLARLEYRVQIDTCTRPKAERQRRFGSSQASSGWPPPTIVAYFLRHGRYLTDPR